MYYSYENLLPIDENGYYGEFGGAYVPAPLAKILREVETEYRKAIADPAFQAEFEQLLRDYVGRPTPLYHAKKLSQRYGADIYLKREDLCHTGAHKINNAIGLGLLARRMGKKRLIAETGAGQHGVAAATVAALLGMECTVFMGEEDVRRQHPNVMRMRMLGTTVVPVSAGAATLNNAVDAALAAFAQNPDDYFYLIGSAVGPAPFPEIVARFQSVISCEIEKQLEEMTGKRTPDYVVAAIGGGSNAAGAFYRFIPQKEVKLVAVEAEGHGLASGETAASITAGKTSVVHGARTKVLVDEEGNLKEAYSISAGLDYPGIGPLQAYLAGEGRTRVITATDREALEAALRLSVDEGIIPALESSHALAGLEKLQFKPGDVVVVNLSGRGDKDMDTYCRVFEKN